jgi:hypothetical protein
MKKLLIIDHSDPPNCEGRKKPVLRLITIEELLDEIQCTRHDMTHKIAIYAIGECLLDWS